MTLASTHSDSSVTGGVTEFVLSSDTSKRPTSRLVVCFTRGHDRSVGADLFDTEWGEIRGGDYSLISEIVQSSEVTTASRNVLASTGCMYANTITYGLLSQSDVDTMLLGVLHAEDFDPQEFHDLGEQQSLLTPSLPIIEASKFLPATLVSFSESLVELLCSEAQSFGVPVLGCEWSVFADPEDLGKELVLGVTVNATSERALEFWDEVSEKISARKRLLSLADQKALSKHLSVQIYWP